MNVVGLDLGSQNLKAVEIERIKGKPELARFSSRPSPKVSLSSDSKNDLKEYAKELASFWAGAGFESNLVSLALPESQVFTRVISLPKMSDKELKEAISWEAEQYIPLPIKEVSFGYHSLGSPAGAKAEQIEVLLVAAPKRVAEKYMQVLEEADLEVLGIETEPIAISRSVLGSGSESFATLIANIGAAVTNLSISYRGGVYFTRSVATGGTALDRTISQEFGFQMSQAEEYKKSYGLDESQLEGKVAQALRPVFDVITAEIRKSLTFFKNRYPQVPVKRVILCGGVANLPGILVYLASTLGIEVQQANPWRRLTIPSKFSTQELDDRAPSFAVAVGLALREF